MEANVHHFSKILGGIKPSFTSFSVYQTYKIILISFSFRLLKNGWDSSNQFRRPTTVILWRWRRPSEVTNCLLNTSLLTKSAKLSMKRWPMSFMRSSRPHQAKIYRLIMLKLNYYKSIFKYPILLMLNALILVTVAFFATYLPYSLMLWLRLMLYCVLCYSVMLR